MISSMNSTIAARSMMHSTSLPARCVFSARTSCRTPVVCFCFDGKERVLSFFLLFSLSYRLLASSAFLKKIKNRNRTVVHLRGDLLDVYVDSIEDAPLLDDEDACCWREGRNLRGKTK